MPAVDLTRCFAIFSAHLTLLDRTLAVDVCPSVHPSVCPSVRRMIEDSSSFLGAKICGPQFRGSPRTSVLKTGQKLWKAVLA